MKTKQIITIATMAYLFVMNIIPSHAQLLKKLSKRVSNAAEETLYRKAEQKTAEETSEAFDSLFNNPQYNDGNIKNDGYANDSQDQNSYAGNTVEEGITHDENSVNETSNEITVYRKFDFTPGERILLYDDFTMDNIGDFPSKWDTNGSGELIKFSSTDEQWFRLVNHSTYLPYLTNDLPDEYTIEFDVISDGIDTKTSSAARLRIQLDEEKSFQNGQNRAEVSIPFALYIDAGIGVKNYVDGKSIISNNIKSDIREAIKDKFHISIAVNRQRYRLWINEEKVIDIPRLIPEGKITCLKIYSDNFRDGKEAVYINNFKIAEGGVDLRHQLISEGQFSTSGILFDVNSAKIKPESYPVIKDIAQILNENPTLNILVVGHTDSDGDEESNLELSKKRAQSIKRFMVAEFSIEENRIDIDGKGELEPVDSNATTTGKANNRRVEFIKI